MNNNITYSNKYMLRDFNQFGIATYFTENDDIVKLLYFIPPPYF